MTNLDNITNVRKDGSELVISMRGKIIVLQGVDVVYCTLRDITERIRMEEEARSIQSKLIQANKMTVSWPAGIGSSPRDQQSE